MNAGLEYSYPAGGALVHDYLTGVEGARVFLPAAPEELDSYASQWARVAPRFGKEARLQAAEFIRSPSVGDDGRLVRWVEEGGAVVTTGQQPGLFGGPLYSLYKGLTAIRLARELEDRLEIPVLPVFWVASEDHDWEEVGHTWLLDQDNELRKLEVEVPPGEGDRPLHRVVPGPRLTKVLEEFLELLPPTDFRPALEILLREAYTERSTLSEGFHHLLDGLLGPAGLYRVDAGDPALKASSLPVLQREVTEWAAHGDLLASRAKDLETAGYGVQAAVLPAGVNLFVEGDGGRERLFGEEDGGFHLRHSQARLTLQGILDLLERDPTRVSPNVFLRPVVESHILPVLSYVAGPGEMAYWAQLEPLFQAHDLPMPVVHPRVGVTVVEGKVAKVLEKFALEVEALARPHHELAGELLREDMPPGIRQAMGELKGLVARGVSKLGDEVKGVDPTLKGPVDHVRSQTFHALDEVEKKVVQALKRENEISLAQLEKARMNLFPNGRPQERILNAAYYLVRYGNAFLDQIRAELPLPLDRAPSEPGLGAPGSHPLP